MLFCKAVEEEMMPKPVNQLVYLRLYQRAVSYALKAHILHLNLPRQSLLLVVYTTVGECN